jgi:DNA-directed RNA polymerase subunit RPC12/RpoP
MLGSVYWSYSCPRCHAEWEIEESREAKCPQCGAEGVLMGPADALASSQADLPAPNMGPLLADHIANLKPRDSVAEQAEVTNRKPR